MNEESNFSKLADEYKVRADQVAWLYMFVGFFIGFIVSILMFHQWIERFAIINCLAFFGRFLGLELRITYRLKAEELTCWSNVMKQMSSKPQEVSNPEVAQETLVVEQPAPEVQVVVAETPKPKTKASSGKRKNVANKKTQA